MVRRITITLDDIEFERWKEKKGKKSWYEFFHELVSREEGIECIPMDKVHRFIQRDCEVLSEFSRNCSECKREEILLRICSNNYKREHLLRAVAIILSMLEEELDEYSAWIIKTLKAAIIEVGKGNIKSAKEVLNEVCSS